LWLPGGRAATVTVEPETDQDGSSEETGGEAAFTLHSPHLGAVEVRIRLDAAGVRAAVTTPPGPMSERAAATLPDLVAGLERATGRMGIASVQSRRGSKPGPTPPEGAHDGYA
jgi:Flagellar hook-length control protein FliK